MQPYVPNALPLTELDFRRLLPLVGQANAALARYDGLLQGIPNPAVMLSHLPRKRQCSQAKSREHKPPWMKCWSRKLGY